MSTEGKLNATVIEHEIFERYHKGPIEYSIGVDEYIREIHRFILQRYEDALASGRDVALLGLGSLKSFVKTGSKYKHPSSGDIRVAPDRISVRFVISPSLKSVLVEAIQDVDR